MVKATLATVIFYSLLLPTLTAQEKTKIYLTPSLGVQWGFSKFENKAQLPQYIKSANLVSGAKYGIGALLDFKDKWCIELGYGAADLGLGVRFDSKTDSVESEINGRKLRFITVHRGYLQFLTPGKLIILRKRRGASLRKHAKEKKEYDFLSIFNIGLLGGLSYESLGRFSILNASQNTSNTFIQDNIQLSENFIQVVSKNSINTFIGVYSQFLNKGEKRLQLGIFYQQGFRNKVLTQWSTSINGEEQSNFQTFTKGSNFTFYASYPIKLITFGKHKN